jgi:hypothetical protein
MFIATGSVVHFGRRKYNPELLVCGLLNLAIIAIGISARSFDIIMEHTPQQFSGVSLRMSVILVLIGSSIELPFYAIL